MTDPGAAAIARAKELAAWQCEVEEIAAVIADEHGWDEDRVHAWMCRMAALITRARLMARAEARGMYFRAMRGKQIDGDPVFDRDRWGAFGEWLRQHAGWAKHTTPVDELMRAFLQAQKNADRAGPKRGPVGVAS